MNGILVQKYGGTSVADMACLRQVAQRVYERHRQGIPLVVVVSAMAGETDRLLALSQSCAQQPAPREQDLLVSTGEQVTAALLSMLLQGQGVDSVALTGAQIPLVTTNDHGCARIEAVVPQMILQHLQANRVVVVAGFQGVTRQGDITTLGRGGSDLSAVALAVALRAQACEIYKDVLGVFTADPQVCQDAQRIARISYDEMLELASLGAKVLQTRSVSLAKRYQLPVWVGCTFQETEGTWVVPEEKRMEETVVAACTCDRKESQIMIEGIRQAELFQAKLFSDLAQAKVNVDVIVFSNAREAPMDMMFTVARADLEKALQVSEAMRTLDPEVRVRMVEKIAKVSAVGLGMKTHSGVAASMFQALSEQNIPVLGVSTSEIKISCLIPDRYAELAVRVIHERFGLGKEPH